MSRRSGIGITVVVLLAATSLVFTDSFYAELEVRSEDAGVSSGEVAVRGMTYLAVPVGLALLLAAVVLAVMRRYVVKRDNAFSWAVAVAVAAVATIGLSLIAVPGLARFAREPAHLAGIGVLAVALVGLVALAGVASAGADGKSSTVLAGLTLLAVVAGATSSVLLADRAARDLARLAAKGETIAPGALDPMQLRATPACILPTKRAREVAPIKPLMKLGASSAGVLLYDPVSRDNFLIAPTRIGVLGVTNEICRRPGEPVALEVGSPSADAAIARRFRPVLRFDSREPWRPLNVERFVSETFGQPPPQHDVCTPARTCTGLTNSSQLTGSTAFINIRGTKADGSDYEGPGREACDPHEGRLECEDPTSAIYYHVVRRDHRVYADYWWFQRYDQVPAPLGSGRICGGPALRPFVHEGDWEGVTVVSKFHRPDELDYVIYAAHADEISYTRKGVVAVSRGGAVPVDYERPVVYVACGTHAAYPRPCSGPKGCYQTAAKCRRPPCRNERSRYFEAPYDGRAPWARNDDKACFDAVPCLLPLPQSASGAADGWAAWRGRWGKDGPRSPGRQGRFAQPWEPVPSNRTVFGRQAEPGAVPESPPPQGR